MNQSWLTYYRNKYYPLLNPDPLENAGILANGMYKRDIGFDIMFRLLLNKKQNNFSIIETGTLRTPGQWKDGQSAFLFTEFVITHGGQVRLPMPGGSRALTTNCDLPTWRARGLTKFGSEPYLHVSAGMGTSPFARIRVASPPEVSLVTLTAKL